MPPANASRTLGGHPTSLGPLDRRPVAADNASRTQSVVAHPLGPSNGAAQEYCSLSEQCLPLWGRWPSVSEVGRGSYHLAEMLFWNDRCTALRMLAINPAFVTHCPRRLAAKFPLIESSPKAIPPLHTHHFCLHFSGIPPLWLQTGSGCGMIGNYKR